MIFAIRNLDQGRAHMYSLGLQGCAKSAHPKIKFYHLAEAQTPEPARSSVFASVVKTVLGVVVASTVLLGVLCCCAPRTVFRNTTGVSKSTLPFRGSSSDISFRDSSKLLQSVNVAAAAATVPSPVTSFFSRRAVKMAAALVATAIIVAAAVLIYVYVINRPAVVVVAGSTNSKSTSNVYNFSIYNGPDAALVLGVAISVTLALAGTTLAVYQWACSRRPGLFGAQKCSPVDLLPLGPYLSSPEVGTLVQDWVVLTPSAPLLDDTRPSTEGGSSQTGCGNDLNALKEDVLKHACLVGRYLDAESGNRMGEEARRIMDDQTLDAPAKMAKLNGYLGVCETTLKDLVHALADKALLSLNQLVLEARGTENAGLMSISNFVLNVRDNTRLNYGDKLVTLAHVGDLCRCLLDDKLENPTMSKLVDTASGNTDARWSRLDNIQNYLRSCQDPSLTPEIVDRIVSWTLRSGSEAELALRLGIVLGFLERLKESEFFPQN